jgi:HEAT repeat protein
MPVVPTNVAAETLNVIAVAQVDAEPFVRRMAIKAAAAIRHPQSLFIIASALQDADLRVVWEAALHLAIVSLPTDTNIITTITVNGPIAAVAPINAPRATIDLILSAVLPDARFPLPLAVAQCLRGDIGQLAALKEALNTSDGVLRQELLTLFCRQVHHPAAVSILAEQFTKLASEAVVDETSQLNIIAAWGAIANDTVAPLLLGVISQKTENPNLRLAAIQAIGQFKSPSIIEQLLQELLKGQSTRVGEALLTTILNSADATTVEILLRARKDAQGEIRPVIELALQRLGITVENLSAQLQGNNFSKTLVAGQDPALNVRWLATLGGQSSINSLIANLKHPSSLVRIAAINILADLGEPRATENLFPLLDESNAQVRDAAATALKKLGFSSATLRTRLESPNWRVRAEAANLTGRMHFTELIPLLINNLSDKEVEVRTESVIALGKLQAIDALDSLIAALQDENSRVHCATAIALGSLGSSAMGKMLTEQLLQEKVLPALLPALNSYDIAFSALAAEAIVKLQPPNLAALLSNVVISRNWRTRVQAARILGSAMDMASINLLLKLLADKAAPVRYYARNSLIRQSAVAVKPLIAALKQQTNENDRYTLAQTLIGIGPAAVEDLLPILLEPAEDLRLITITVLAEIGDPRAITALLPLCDDPRFLIRQNAAIALGRLGPPALMPILELLNADKSVRQRISATITLRTLADPAAIPLLLEALNDKNAQLRAAAAEALAFIGDRSTLPALEKLTNDVADVVRAAVRNAINKIQAQH